MTVLAAELAAYEEQWVTTLQAVRTLGRLGKWAKRITADSDAESLNGIIAVSANHRSVRQCVEVVVTPGEVRAVLWDMTGPDDWVLVDESGSLRRGELIRLLNSAVGAWRRLGRLDSVAPPAKSVLR